MERGQLKETNNPAIIQNIKDLFNDSPVCQHMKVYELQGSLKLNFYEKINEKIPMSCRDTKNCLEKCVPNPPSYIEIFNLIQNKISSGKKIMVYGGSVRDFIHSNGDITTMNDIDINYSTDYNKIVDYFTHNCKQIF